MTEIVPSINSGQIASNYYSRTITLKEEREGYILVPKHRLSLFPSLGQLFTLKTADKERIVKVEVLKCNCDGTEMYHEHYLLRWTGLSEGDHVVIEQNVSTPRQYKMVVE